LPGTLYRAARFYFDLGEKNNAMMLAFEALRADPQNGSAFDEYDNWKVPLRDVLGSGLPPIPHVWRSFLRRQMQEHEPEDAKTVWSWMIRREGYVDQSLSRDYVNFLISNKQSEAAAEAWAVYAAPRNKGYPQSDRIFNGGFESDLEKVRFDWTIDPLPGTAIDLATDTRHSGARALRIRFNGDQNVGETGVQEDVFLKPGRYRFQAYVRVKDLSTDQGVFFRLRYEEKSEQRDVTTESVRGTTDWTLLERVFDMPRDSGLVTVSLAREPSLKFDNLVRGTLWVDDESITPIDSAPLE
jgi:hypothetical protein